MVYRTSINEVKLIFLMLKPRLDKLVLITLTKPVTVLTIVNRKMHKYYIPMSFQTTPTRVAISSFAKTIASSCNTQGLALLNSAPVPDNGANSEILSPSIVDDARYVTPPKPASRAPLPNINSMLYKSNTNRRKKYSYHYMRIPPKTWKPRKLNFDKFPQMDFLHKLLPSVKIDISDRVEEQSRVTNENFNRLNEVVEHISKHGISHDLKFPALENIFSQLSACWANEDIRETLMMFASVLMRVANRWLKNDVLVLIVEAFSVYLSWNCKDTKKSLIYSGIVMSLQFFDIADRTDSGKHPQMDVDLLVPLLTGIYGWMYYAAFKKEYKGDSLSDFLKECHSIKKAKEGCLDLVEFLCEAFERMVRLLSGETFSSVFSNNLFPELDIIAKETQTYLEQFNKGLPFSKDEATRIIDIVSDLEKLIVKIPKTAMYTEYYKKAMLLQARVNQFIKEIKKAGMFDDGVRITPMAILIVGPSKVGKTTCLTQFMYELAAMTMPDETFDKYVKAKDDFQYTYCPENEYFDRYRKQYFCVVDEFGAQRDSAQKPNDGYLFVMRAINCWPYPVHMADLADKGMMFDSQFVIAIGNIKTLMIHSLIDPEPVCRRISFPLIMVPKKPFCIEGTADSDNLWDRRLHIPSLRGRAITDYSHMEFYRFDPKSGLVTSDAIEWREMLDTIASTYIASRAESQKRLEALPEVETFCRNLRKNFKPQMDDYQPGLNVTNVGLDYCKARMNKIWRDFRMHCEETYYDVTEGMSSSMELIQEQVTDILYAIKSNPFISGLVVSVPVALMAWKYFSTVVLKMEQSVFPKIKTVGKAQIKTNARIVNKLSEQMCSANVNFDNIVSSVLKNNHYLIKTQKGQRASFTFVKGRIGVFPHHFYCHWRELEDEGDEVILTFTKCMNQGSTFEIRFKDIKFLQLDGDTDLIFALIPKMYMHRDISKFLITRDEKLFLGSFHGALARFNADILKLHTTEVRPVGAFKYSFYANERSYEYNIATTVGECGEILFSSDSRSTTRVLGIHVCGDGMRTGDSVAIFKEDFDLVFSVFEKEGYQHVQVEPEEDGINLKQPQMELDSRFVLVKKVDKMVAASNNTIIKSPLHGCWGESNYAPTVLHERDGVDPWANARSNYNPPYKSMNLNLLEICTQSYSNVCRQSSRASFEKPRIFTYREAVEGIPGIYKGIPRSTSAGYPLANSWKGKGKTVPFGTDGPYTFESEEALKIEAEVSNAILMMAKGIRLDFTFMDHLKAERRKKDKVAAMKLRLFSASPLVYLIICRQYFGCFTQWIIDNNVFNHIAVGVNAFSDDWGRLVRHLRSVGDNNIFGDYSAYDGSQSPFMLYSALEFIEDYYYNSTAEERVIRAVLFEDLVNSKHIFNSTTDPLSSYQYEWMGSVPSGHPLTTHVNSIVNNIILRYCMVQILSRHIPERFNKNVPDMDYLEANVRIIVYGDDNGVSVSDNLKCITQENMTFEMSLIGMTYTSEDKTSVHLLHRPLEECSFLKCAFRYDEDIGKWVAAQSLESILDMPYWTKSNGKDPESVNKTVDILLHKLALHGKDTFNTYANTIISASCEKLNYKPMYTTYIHNRDNILDMEFEF